MSAAVENFKIQIINVLRETIEELGSFDEPCCGDEEIFRKGLSTGLGVAREIIKRGSNRRLVEYSLDFYREEHAGEDFKSVSVKD